MGWRPTGQSAPTVLGHLTEGSGVTPGVSSTIIIVKLLEADLETLATSKPGVFAGGDIVTGGAR